MMRSTRDYTTFEYASFGASLGVNVVTRPKTRSGPRTHARTRVLFLPYNGQVPTTQLAKMMSTIDPEFVELTS